VALREEPRALVMPLNTFLQRRVVGRQALVVVLWYRYLPNDALASSWRGRRRRAAPAAVARARGRQGSVAGGRRR